MISTFSSFIRTFMKTIAWCAHETFLGAFSQISLLSLVYVVLTGFRKCNSTLSVYSVGEILGFNYKADQRHEKGNARLNL